MNHNPELDAFPLEAYSNNASTEAPLDLVVLGELEQQIQTEVSEMERTRSSRRQRRGGTPVSSRRQRIRPPVESRQAPKRNARNELMHELTHDQAQNMKWHWWLLGGLAALFIMRR